MLADKLGLPLILIFLTSVRFDLVPHASQHVRRGLGRDDDRRDNGGRDLPDYAPHSSRHTLLLMLLGCDKDDVLGGISKTLLVQIQGYQLVYRFV